ncbi:TnsA endonuclease N-terminal domain-containing protein [Ralstonia nicotianae]|nr:TnsA endonuclease N-terminal domain-containing protein [Ralstonia solanacearum]
MSRPIGLALCGVDSAGSQDLPSQCRSEEPRVRSRVRSYYPDFIFQREEPDGRLTHVIVEVKADTQIEDAVVQAKKDLAQQIAVASGMEYRILKSTDVRL